MERRDLWEESGVSDKIREEFEKDRSYLDLRWNDKTNRYYDIYTNAVFNEYLCGYSSRDEEIKKLKQDCKNLVEINNNQTVIIKLADEEIKQLKIACNQYGKRLVLLGEDDVVFYATDFLKDGE